MRYSIDRAEKYTVLTPEEEKLDSLKAPMLKSELVTLFQSGTENLILDMQHVKYVDSSGLSAILVAKRLADETNGELVIASLSEHVEKLLKISKLDSVLKIVADKEAAAEVIFLNEIEKENGAE
ncbi:STAS domain-containing protein [Algivirga pacifica]|uniref:Anti-sigma factor antagonist n=1 Tax=Algivirga pacifica TaxID=1162670 RepID=A0ABP9CXQ6_9BACT